MKQEAIMVLTTSCPLNVIFKKALKNAMRYAVSRSVGIGSDVCVATNPESQKQQPHEHRTRLSMLPKNGSIGLADEYLLQGNTEFVGAMRYLP